MYTVRPTRHLLYVVRSELFCRAAALHACRQQLLKWLVISYTAWQAVDLQWSGTYFVFECSHNQESITATVAVTFAQLLRMHKQRVAAVQVICD